MLQEVFGVLHSAASPADWALLAVAGSSLSERASSALALARRRPRFVSRRRRARRRKRGIRLCGWWRWACASANLDDAARRDGLAQHDPLQAGDGGVGSACLGRVSSARLAGLARRERGGAVGQVRVRVDPHAAEAEAAALVAAGGFSFCSSTNGRVQKVCTTLHRIAPPAGFKCASLAGLPPRRSAESPPSQAGVKRS